MLLIVTLLFMAKFLLFHLQKSIAATYYMYSWENLNLSSAYSKHDFQNNVLIWYVSYQQNRNSLNKEVDCLLMKYSTYWFSIAAEHKPPYCIEICILAPIQEPFWSFNHYCV